MFDVTIWMQSLVQILQSPCVFGHKFSNSVTFASNMEDCKHVPAIRRLANSGSENTVLL